MKDWMKKDKRLKGAETSVKLAVLIEHRVGYTEEGKEIMKKEIEEAISLLEEKKEQIDNS